MIRGPVARLRNLRRREERQPVSTYTATIRWDRGEARFVDNRYSRAHAWIFDGGITVPASSSPHVVPLPHSDANAVDPEEAFVASIASCHMLTFLAIAAKRGLRVDHYADAAVGTMERNAEGRLAITRVVLRPVVVFSGERSPTDDDLAAMHHQAHEECYIANSVRTEVVCEPRSR
jgi:organic hydroperoxide reductase OsmC/OhrA